MAAARPFLIVIFFCAAAPVAQGEEPSPACLEADKLLDQGVTTQTAGRDAEALVLFQQAHAKCPTPRFMARIAQAEATLDRWLDADQHIQTVLRSPDPWVAKNRAALEEMAGVIDKHVGRVRFAGGGPWVEVLLDGQTAKAPPIAEPIALKLGKHLVTIRIVGGKSEDREITIEAGLTFTIELPAEPPPPVVDPTPVGTKVPPPRPRTPALRIAGGIGLGVAALALGGAIAATVIRNQHAARWNDDQACLYSDVTKSRIENCKGDWDAIHLAQNLSIAGYAVGGALAVASVVLIALPVKKDTKVAWTCGGGPSALGVACAGTF